MTYVRKSTNRSKRKNRSKRNYRKKTNNLKYSRNKNTRKKLGGSGTTDQIKIPFIAALLSHLVITRANLSGTFPELDGDVTEETLQGIFTTPIKQIDGSSGFAIFNVQQYDPTGTGVTTGHIFMVARDMETKNIGSIGFYPVNYRSYFGLVGATFGATGALVTPDPIAKKYLRNADINAGDFELIKFSAKPIRFEFPDALKTLNDTLSKNPLRSFKETSVYETNINYQPLAMGFKAENCLTYIQNHLGIDLDAGSSVPNLAFGSAAGAGERSSLASMVSGAYSAVGNMLSSGYGSGIGGSRKRLRRKSKNKRNNIKKTRRRRINKY